MARKDDQHDSITPEPEDQAVTLTFGQLKELLGLSKPTQEDQLALMREQAKLNAEEHRKLTKPENAQHPAISVFSRPKGEIEDPKPPFRCKMTWGGTDIFHNLSTAEEVDLLNAVKPGTYLCARPDGSRFKVDVVATHSDNGRLERIEVKFITTGQLKHGLPSMVTMLREMQQQAVSSSAASLVAS